MQATKKILIIEDVAYTHLLQSALTNSYQILTAQSGNEGLALALSEQPDLIVLDVRLPYLSGVSLLRHLREDAYGEMADVIFLTDAEPGTNTLRKVIAAKPLYYWIKYDMDLAEIIERIHSIMAYASTPATAQEPAAYRVKSITLLAFLLTFLACPLSTS